MYKRYFVTVKETISQNPFLLCQNNILPWMQLQVVAYQGEARGVFHLVHTFPDLDGAFTVQPFFDALKMVEQRGGTNYAIWSPVKTPLLDESKKFIRELKRTQLYVVKEHFEPVIIAWLLRHSMSWINLRGVGSHPHLLARWTNIKAVRSEKVRLCTIRWERMKHIRGVWRAGFAVISLLSWRLALLV